MDIILRGNIFLADVPVTSNAEHEEEMMKSDFVKLSWSSDSRIVLPADAYIVPFTDGVRYALLEPYEPQQKSETEWLYEPLFQHPKMLLSKVTFKRPSYDTQGNPITLIDWSYTGFIGKLLQYFCDQINDALGLTGDDVVTPAVDGEIDNTVSVSFSAQDILSALTATANALECEWHIDWEKPGQATKNRVLHFGHITFDHEELAAPILEVGQNIGIPSVRSSKNGFWNAFEPQGSTRNITVRAASGENVQSNVRLSLDKTTYPDGIIYTDGHGNVITKEAFDNSGVHAFVKPLIFDDVYPKLDLYVYNVRGRERYLLDGDNKKVVDHYDGNEPVYKRYTVWYIRLAYPTYNADKSIKEWTDLFDGLSLEEVKKQIIDGKELMVAFQPNTEDGAETSPLAGRGDGGDGYYGFGLRYHQSAETIPANDEDTGVEILAGDFEIVFQEKDGYILPTTASQGIVPKGKATPSLLGNKVNVYNIVMSDDYVASARNDLLNETLKYIAKDVEDKNSYTFKAYETAFYDDNPGLYVGQKVIFRNGDYELATRVMKLVTKVDYAFEQEITVGNEILKGNQTQVREKVETLISYMTQSSGINETAVTRLISNWVTPRFLSKLTDDVAEGVITFVKGLWVKAKGLFGIDEEGNGIFNTLSALSGIINSLQSGNYDGDGTAGAGWQITNDDGNGNSRLTVDNLYVRMKAVFNELEVRKMVHTAGNYIFSPAGSVIELVDYLDAEGNVLGYEAVKVPWVLRLVPLTLREKLLSRTKLRKVNTLSNADKAKVATFRCWVVADDGTTQTINTWQTGYLARCETFNVKGDDTQKHADDAEHGIINEKSGVEEGKATGNTFYWRKVTGVGESERLHVDDGKVHNYVELSNTTGEYYPGSDWPSAGDSIVCYGVADASLREYSNLVIIETVGDDAPAIKEYLGIGLYDDGTAINWSLTGKMRTKISPRTGNVFYGNFKVSTGSGYTDVNTLIDNKMSEFEVTIDGITATVKRILSNNILTGVLDGNGWIGENKTPAIVTSDNGIYGSGNKLYSPYLSLDKHKQYVVSFYRNRDGGSLNVYVNNGTDQDWESGRYASQEEVTVHEANETARGLQRYYFTIGQPAESGYTWIYFEGVTATYPIYYPQIEEGTEVSPFSASGIEIGSRITQTSDEIRSEVSNGLSGLSSSITQQADRITAVVNDVNGVKNGLSATGIDIQHREITMTADKFTLNNNDGEQVLGTDANGNLDVTGIVHASGGEFTGTIHANDGEFTGTVHAKLMYSDIKIITDTYTVVPGEQPYTFYLIRLNRGGTVPITLPDPTVYEGLEMSFFQPPVGETRLSEGGKAMLVVENPSTTRIISTGGQRSMFGYSNYEWLKLEDINTGTAYTITEGHLITVKAIDGNWRVVSHVRESYGGPCITKSKEETITANTTLDATYMPKVNIFQLKVNSNATLTLPGQDLVESAFGWAQGSLPTNFVYRFTIVVNYASLATLTVTGSSFKDNNGNIITSHQMAKGDTAEILCSMCNGFHYQLLWYSK